MRIVLKVKWGSIKNNIPTTHEVAIKKSMQIAAQ
jgi:hypothetical protein